MWALGCAWRAHQSTRRQNAWRQSLREEMQIELRKLQRNLGLTTVIVTHDQREAIVLSDRIAVMKDGRIEQVGTPLEIHDHPQTRYVAAFTGVENLLPGRFL